MKCNDIGDSFIYIFWVDSNVLYILLLKIVVRNNTKSLYQCHAIDLRVFGKYFHERRGSSTEQHALEILLCYVKSRLDFCACLSSILLYHYLKIKIWFLVIKQ